MKNWLNWSKEELEEQFWATEPRIRQIFRNSRHMEEPRDLFFDYLNRLERDLFNMRSDTSAFRVARARIDPAKVSEADLRARLTEAGYLGDLPIETEAWKTGTPAEVVDNPFRHTAALENIKGVAFGQKVEDAGRALWPCPGIGPIQKMDE